MAENNVQELSKESDIRLHKINTLKGMGINPYAPKFNATHSISQARNMPEGTVVSVGGRMTFRRIFGKLSFLQIADIHDKLQVSVAINYVGEEQYKFFKDFIDIGDYVGFTGELYYTQTGEYTVRATEVKLLSKAMYPLPEKFHGLTDIEARYRQRYLDLISNDETKKIFKTRSKVINYIRNFLVDNDFMEVETPILQSVACGAAAKPFVTKHNALDKTYNLRISPETFLKQVVCGGIPRAFEIGKNFRNEGMDANHLQEFTMLEWYASFWDFNDNIDFITKLLRELVHLVHGSGKMTYQGVELDFDAEFDRVDYIKSLNDLLGLDILSYDDVEELKKDVIKLDIFDRKEIEDTFSLGGLFDLMYKRKIRPSITQPTILYNFPKFISE